MDVAEALRLVDDRGGRSRVPGNVLALDCVETRTNDVACLVSIT